MKILMTLLLVVLLSVTAIAQTAAPYTPIEETKIKEGVGAILKYIETQQSGDSASFWAHLNAPDVVDKALKKFGDGIVFLYANVEKAAPQAWRIMRYQQIAKAWSGIVGPVLWMLLIIFYFYFVNKKWQKSADEVWNDNFRTLFAGFWYRITFARILPSVAAFICIWVGAVQFKTSIQLWVNPDYYAIKDLLVLMLGSGQGL